jgi:hypothetical protein
MRAGAWAAALWLLMMAAWLAGLGLGAWQAWPAFAGPAAPQDVVAAAMWLVIGGAAWLLALNLGLQRYRARRR